MIEGGGFELDSVHDPIDSEDKSFFVEVVVSILKQEDCGKKQRDREESLVHLQPLPLGVASLVDMNPHQLWRALSGLRG